MKKKSLKGLALKKYSISNLSLLHQKIGGNIETNTELETTSPSIIFSLNECTIISDCPSDIYTCNCNTNNGTVKAQPPTQHEQCPPTNNNSNIIL